MNGKHTLRMAKATGSVCGARTASKTIADRRVLLISALRIH